MPSLSALRLPLAPIVLLFAVSCGGSDAPGTPSSPSPSSAPSGAPGGALAGAYLLEVRPAASCGMGGPLTFPMTAAAAGTSPHPGVQVLLAGAENLELELLSSSNTVTGGFGTTELGALGNETVRIWLHAIGTGAVTRAADGRGEITSGRLAGYVAFGHAGGEEGSLGSCDSTSHSFVLRVR